MEFSIEILNRMIKYYSNIIIFINEININNRENILLLGEHLKLADFGSCKGMFSEHPYTEYISTRWYRAPECLMTDGYYDYKVLNYYII